ncbi:hypothetical protein [Hymenobacter sp. B81]|uniref:hypothetical protein n=1 Tax=Hymenobacter sp. B81 TaxID=3344878 RepID=UPI0037DD40A8
MHPDSIKAIEELRRLAAQGFWEPQLDDNNDIIGILASEPTFEPVTPQHVDEGRDAEQTGTYTEIVANTAWDREGNELERIDANTHYICRLHNVFPGIVSRLREAEATLRRASAPIAGPSDDVIDAQRYATTPGATQSPESVEWSASTVLNRAIARHYGLPLDTPAYAIEGLSLPRAVVLQVLEQTGAVAAEAHNALSALRSAAVEPTGAAEAAPDPWEVMGRLEESFKTLEPFGVVEGSHHSLAVFLSDVEQMLEDVRVLYPWPSQPPVKESYLKTAATTCADPNCKNGLQFVGPGDWRPCDQCQAGLNQAQTTAAP